MEVIAAALDTDRDGVLALDVIKKVVEVVAREGADVQPRDLDMLARLVERELAMEAEERAAAEGGAAGAGAPSAAPAEPQALPATHALDENVGNVAKKQNKTSS